MSGINGIRIGSMEFINNPNRYEPEKEFIDLGKSIGKISLGMNKEDVKRAYPNQELVHKGSFSDEYASIGLRIHYNEQNIVVFLSVSPLMNLFLKISGKELDIFNSSIEECAALLRQIDPYLEEEELGITSQQYGISLVIGDEGEPPTFVELFPIKAVSNELE